MKVNAETREIMKDLARKCNIELSAENFSYLSCECLANEVMILLEMKECTVKDIQTFLLLLNEKIEKSLIKQRDLSSTTSKEIE